MFSIFLSKLVSLARTSISRTSLFLLALISPLCQIVKLRPHHWDVPITCVGGKNRGHSLARFGVWCKPFFKKNLPDQTAFIFFFCSFVQQWDYSSPALVAARIHKATSFLYSIRNFWDAVMTNNTAEKESQQALHLTEMLIHHWRELFLLGETQKIVKRWMSPRKGHRYPHQDQHQDSWKPPNTVLSPVPCVWLGEKS